MEFGQGALAQVIFLHLTYLLSSQFRSRQGISTDLNGVISNPLRGKQTSRFADFTTNECQEILQKKSEKMPLFESTYNLVRMTLTHAF